MLDILLLVLMQPAFVLPPATEGGIDGKGAVLVWPADPAGKLLDPAGCNVQMIPSDEPATRLTFPCGRWFLPPRSARYEFWLEQENRISSSQAVMFYDRSRAQTGFRLAARLTDGGFVSSAIPLRDGETVRIVSLGNPASAFELGLRSDEIRRPVVVPAGLTLAGVFDGLGSALALSRPFDVPVAQAKALAFAPPAAGTADVLVVLQKWGRVRPTNVRAELSLGDAKRAPDLLRETESRVFAVWYGIAPGMAEVRVTAPKFETNLLPATLRADRVSTIRADYPARSEEQN